MKFVHLHTHSHYSLLDGLAKVDELVNRCKELRMDSLALTDHGHLYGAIEFYKTAKKAGVKPILGVETYIAPFGRLNKRAKIDNQRYHLILLAENETGWKNLIQLINKAHLEGFYYKPRIDKEILREHSEGLIGLSACISGEVSRLLLSDKFEEAVKSALEYADIFGKNNFFLEIGAHPNIPGSDKARELMKKVSEQTGLPLVATQDIHYLNKEDNVYHDILLAVQTGNQVGDGERLSMKEDNFSMRSPEEMAELFKDYPEAIENTIKIAERCSVEIELGKIQLPQFKVPERETAMSYLRKLIDERITNRYPSADEKTKERIEFELATIERMGFADYFLIVQDIINWARSRGIVVGPGRGSAAGSIVSYILGITSMDPIKYDLLFERFLNPDRIQMPDIDIDFTDARRDEVIAYVREKYGHNHVAQIITFGTMAARAAIRDAGRALNLPYSFCDKIAKLIPFNADLNKALETIPDLKSMYMTDRNAERVIDAAKKLEGVARHASVHACGLVIAPRPLTDYMPMQYAPQHENVVTTQFEMHTVEDLGLLKMDFLGLTNLTIIEETLRLIDQIKGERLDINSIPLNDEETFKLLQNGETTGVFQLESSGMRHYLKELKPNDLEDIIAMVALYRPGPMELIPQYINRKFGKETITYLHPKLEPILKNTYGVGIYQEQMMRIARDLAGFTLAEADTLRKAIGKKIKSLLDEQGAKLINGMVKNGIDQKTAEAIWDLFPPFARYGFNRSHAACYALIAYQTAYLKAHYPVEFTTGLLNASASEIDRIAFLVNDARRLNIKILPPDVNQSLVNFSPEGNDIRFGLLAVKNLGANIVSMLIEERNRSGPFSSLNDLLTRIHHRDLNKKSLEALIKCGSLDSLGVERKAALESIEDLVKFNSAIKRAQTANQSNLFGGVQNIASLKLKDVPPATAKEKLGWEKELLGLYVSDNPLNEYLPKINKIKPDSIKVLLASKEGGVRKRVTIAGIVSAVKKFVTKNGQPMVFATIEDANNDAIETLVFSDTLSANPDLWQESNIIALAGRMSWRNGDPKVICDKAVAL